MITPARVFSMVSACASRRLVSGRENLRRLHRASCLAWLGNRWMEWNAWSRWRIGVSSLGSVVLRRLQKIWCMRCRLMGASCRVIGGWLICPGSGSRCRRWWMRWLKLRGRRNWVYWGRRRMRTWRGFWGVGGRRLIIVWRTVWGLGRMLVLSRLWGIIKRAWRVESWICWRICKRYIFTYLSIPDSRFGMTCWESSKSGGTLGKPSLLKSGVVG